MADTRRKKLSKSQVEKILNPHKDEVTKIDTKKGYTLDEVVKLYFLTQNAFDTVQLYPANSHILRICDEKKVGRENRQFLIDIIHDRAVYLRFLYQSYSEIEHTIRKLLPSKKEMNSEVETCCDLIIALYMSEEYKQNAREAKEKMLASLMESSVASGSADPLTPSKAASPKKRKLHSPDSRTTKVQKITRNKKIISASPVDEKMFTPDMKNLNCIFGLQNIYVVMIEGALASSSVNNLGVLYGLKMVLKAGLSHGAALKVLRIINEEVIKILSILLSNEVLAIDAILALNLDEKAPLRLKFSDEKPIPDVELFVRNNFSKNSHSISSFSRSFFSSPVYLKNHTDTKLVLEELVAVQPNKKLKS